MKELAVYIKKHHTTGLTWNAKGGDAPASAPSSAPASGGPPKAPPPPPAAPPPSTSSAPEKASANPANLFADINKGTAISAGLKKVTKDMKTSNRADKSSLVPAAASEAKEKATEKKPAAGQKKGVPKFELNGNKWLVEWQDGATIEIKDVEMKQTVFIYKCEKTTVRVFGKVNTISLDSCKRVGVVFEDVLSLCEMVNSSSLEIQVLGKIPSVAIDKCSCTQVILSEKSLAVEIVSSKSDQMNVLIPDPAGGPDPVEIAIPEQFKTTINNGKLVTTSVEHV